MIIYTYILYIYIYTYNLLRVSREYGEAIGVVTTGLTTGAIVGTATGKLTGTVTGLLTGTATGELTGTAAVGALHRLLTSFETMDNRQLAEHCSGLWDTCRTFSLSPQIPEGTCPVRLL